MPKFKSIWGVTQQSAHPRARQLINQSVIWNYGDEDSPLGTDTGADTFVAFLEFRNSNPDRSVRDFMREQLSEYGFSDEDWDLLDSASLIRIHQELELNSCGAMISLLA